MLTSLATGASFLLLGQLRLGALVRYLPYPVVGGFLAGTGWLLLLGGLGVMLGAQPALSVLWRWLPGLLFATLTLLALRRTRHPLALPALFIGAPMLFYLVLAAAGISQAEARAGGWLLAPFPDQVSGAAIGPALLGQSGTILAVVIGLLLNVSGLQIARREEFDLNRELRNPRPAPRPAEADRPTPASGLLRAHPRGGSKMTPASHARSAK